MRPRCLWSHRTGDDLVPITVPRTDGWGRVVGEQGVHVAPEYEQRTRDFVARAVRYGRPFLVGVLLGLAGLIGFATAGRFEAAGGSLVALGLLFQVLPFATPQTVEWFGLRTSIVVARLGGLVLAGLGVLIASGALG